MKTVLIVNPQYPCCVKWITANKRMEALARYLPEHGWNPIFVTQACHCVSCNSPQHDYLFIGLSDDNQEVRNRIATYLQQGGTTIVLSSDYRPLHSLIYRLYSLSGRPQSANHDLLRSLIDHRNTLTKLSARSRIVYALGKMLSVCAGLEGSDFSSRTLSLSESIVDSVTPDLIIGSAPKFSILSTAKALSDRHNIPWIADMRDCLLRSIQEQSRIHTRLKMKCFIKTLQSAKAMIHVSEQEAARDKTLADIPSFIIENGYFCDEIIDALQAPIRNHAFTIRFIGTTYRQQNWSEVITGISEFISEAEIPTHDMRLEFYGDATFIETFAIDHSFIHLMGSVNRVTALRLCAGADVLLHCTYCNSSTQRSYHGVPGAKLYEYLAMNKPLLTIGPADTYVDSLIQHSDVAIRCINHHDVSHALQKIYTERAENRQKPAAISLAYDFYDRKNCISRYAELLQNVMEGNS